MTCLSRAEELGGVRLGDAGAANEALEYRAQVEAPVESVGNHSDDEVMKDAA
jgi:hypothetical protein